MSEQKNTYSSIKDLGIDNNYHVNYIFTDSPLLFGQTTLYQIGRMFCNEKTVVDTHLHNDYYELTIATNGTGVITTNNIDTKISKGDIYLSLPFDTHKITSSITNPLQFDFLSFNTTNPEQIDKLIALQSAFKHPKLRCFNNELIVNLVNHIIVEFSSRSILSEQIVSALLNLVILYSINDFRQNRDVVKYSLNSADILCFQVMNYIDTHITTIKSLEDVSKAFNYNYSYLSALFKNVTGTSMNEFFAQKKFAYAKQLITKGKKVYEVANTLNYSNQYTFSKGFKKYFGISPKQMQQQYNSNIK